MKVEISTCETETSGGSWVGAGGTTIAAKDWPHLATSHSGELQLNFPDDTASAVFTPTAPLALIDDKDRKLRNFGLWVKSNIEGGSDFDTDTYLARIKFEDLTPDAEVSVEYYMPTPTAFDQVIFHNPGLARIDAVTIYCKTTLLKLIISDLIAYTDQLPLDIYTAFTDLIKPIADERRFVIGKVSAYSGATKIQIAGLKFATRFSVISFNGEKHHIQEFDRKTGDISFWPERYDGDKVLRDANDADVYLEFPVLADVTSEEIAIPCISIGNGWEWEEAEVSDDGDIVVDSLKYDADPALQTVRSFSRGYSRKRMPMIEALSHHKSLDEVLDNILTLSLADSGCIYVNGQRTEFFAEKMQQADGRDAKADMVFSVSQYQVEISLTEEIWQEAGTIKRRQEVLPRIPLDPTVTVETISPS